MVFCSGVNNSTGGKSSISKDLKASIEQDKIINKEHSIKHAKHLNYQTWIWRHT